ncbi:MULTISPECIES: nuclear transport factor 2 family protein [Ruegeria]|uniref:nuclear transport factor 2 family protein n=1 Tax=Ruegeria TaxID=97050 RepID=UPI00147B75F3|nr:MULTISPECIES: nuclear transport factor 2 family protein [Ruegeria]
MTPDVQTARRIAQDHCAAWTNRAPGDVAGRYAEHTIMIMNGGDPMESRTEIGDMAAGFMADFPDLVLNLDTVLVADHHMVYAWTFEGHHKETGNHVRFSGWEEWDLDDNLNVTKSLGWYDGVDYERQVAGT